MNFFEKNSGTLFGLFLGWLLTQFAQWYKGRKEDNRVRKEVLYYLLELNYDLDRLNPTTAMDRAMELLDPMIPAELKSIITKEALGAVLSSYIQPILKSSLESSHNLTNERLKVILTKLSSVNPYLAYRLGSFTDILARLEDAKRHTKNVLDNPALNEDAQMIKEGENLLSSLNPIFDKLTFSDNRKELKIVLRRLTFRISPLLFVYHLIWERRKNYSSDEPELQKAVQAYLNQLASLT